MNNQIKAMTFAILAAALYALNSPVSKLLLTHIPPTMLAGFLYLGAGCGIFILGKAKKHMGKEVKEPPLTHKDLPYIIGMVLLDIAAPVCLMLGLKLTNAANASLLNNFEIVATSIIALFIFKESISKRLWGAIFFVTIASIMISFEDISSFSFSSGSLLVLAACTFWGFENNCTKMISSKNPMQIVTIKGLFSGIGSILISLIVGERFFNLKYILFAMLLGFVAYGLSIYFYIYAQRDLGAAKTSTYYSVSPFIGTIISLIIFKQMPSPLFIIALLLMLVGTWLATDKNQNLSKSS